MVLPLADLPATNRSSPGRPLSRHPNVGRSIFAVGGIFSTVGGFDVSAVVAGSGADSISSVGASSISTVGTSGISEPSRSPPPMATGSPASVPPFPSLSPAHPRPEVSMLLDTVAPQMVLPHADLPATTRSSPGRPIFAVGGCAVVVVAPGGIVSTVGGFDVSAAGAGSGLRSRCTVGTGGISAVGWCRRWTPLFRLWRRLFRRLVPRPYYRPLLSRLHRHPQPSCSPLSRIRPFEDHCDSEYVGCHDRCAFVPTSLVCRYWQPPFLSEERGLQGPLLSHLLRHP